MNKYLSLSNFIKENLSNDWMTPSQRKVYDKLINFLYYHDYINLYGAAGTGKTFIGWLLHKNQIGCYFSHCSELKPVSNPIIVDNVTGTRENFRNLIKEVQLADIHKLVVISREPIYEHVAYIKLDCQQADIKKMEDNLNVEKDISGITNLWELFLQIIKE